MQIESAEACTAREVSELVREAVVDRALVYWDGGFASSPLPVHGSIVLGRGLDCGLRADHPSVSRKHAALLLGDEIRIVDLGSANGTRVANVRLAPNVPVVLEAGALVQIGATTLVVHHGAPMAPVRATATASERGILVEDDAMRRLHGLVAIVAPANISVLVLGETGVGKEVIARRLHAASTRRDRSFISINCAALPEALLESELFGYERGAFTGATQPKIGLLEAADGGTVFLDEIGEMPLAAQAKLLRAIETKEVLRVGSVRPRAVDVRFVAATHQRLEEQVARGAFREDLFYRLNGITLRVPALRERPSEILPLALRFLEDARRQSSRPGARLADVVSAVLQAHPWPGNVRELRNVMERAALLSPGAIVLLEHLGLADAPLRASTIPPPPPTVPSVDATLGGEMAALERRRILEALDQCAGNQTRAAELLGIKRGVLMKRLGAYGVPRPRKHGM